MLENKKKQSNTLSNMKFKSCIIVLLLSTAILQAQETTNMSIREIIDAHYGNDTFVFGASARMGYFNKTDSPIVKRWLKEFSYNTPENDFKQSGTYQTPDSDWNPDGFLSQIEGARKYNQVIRAHGPISPQCSGWAREDNRTPEELETMLKLYMTALAKELEANKDVVLWMDVVNETFTQSVQKEGIGYDAKQNNVTYKEDDWFGPRKGIHGWENPWPIMGFETYRYGSETFEVPRYIRMAFEIANEHAPSIKKIYNEHGGVINTNAWEKIKKNVLYLRSQGIQIDGIGWQSHVSLGWEKDPQNVQNLQDVITWCYENNLEFHITELDVAVSRHSEKKARYDILEATRAEQAETIGAVVELMLKNIGKGARGLNMWVMTDRYHGGPTFASLFDRKGNPNPAYYKVKELLLKYKVK